MSSLKKSLTCPHSISIINTVMNQIKLNEEQQDVLELLKTTCKKVELYLNNDKQKEAMCLLEGQKVIEVTFYNAAELCVTYNDFEDNDPCQECFRNYEFNKRVIDRLFKRVTDDINHLQYINSQAHARKILDFLK